MKFTTILVSWSGFLCPQSLNISIKTLSVWLCDFYLSALFVNLVSLRANPDVLSSCPLFLSLSVWINQ